MISTSRRLAAIAATTTALAVAGPVASAYADGPTGSTPAGTTQPPALLGQWPPISLIFVPPAVGPIMVAIGPVIIGGVVISPGVHVSTPGVSLPTLYWHSG
jgi:hypothetical protein